MKEIKITFVLLLTLLMVSMGCAPKQSGQNKRNEIKEVVNMEKLVITSPAFESNSKIPVRYTCDGENINPELCVKDIPQQTKTLMIIVDDPDAPRGTWTHWIVWNIQPIEIIKENSVPGIEGINDFKKHSYGGPCPPSGTHRYFFRVYALDTKLNLNANAQKRDVEKAITGHILAQGELVGLYGRE